MKKCCRCKEVKPLSGFYFSKFGVPRHDCIDCCKDKNKRWRDANQEYEQNRKRQYHLDNKSEDNDRCLAWRKANPGMSTMYKRNREATKRGAPDTHTAADLTRIWEEQAGCCNNPFCCVELTDDNKTVDHIVALSRGGSNGPDNLQYLCRPCNDSKYTKNWDEWLSWYRDTHILDKV